MSSRSVIALFVWLLLATIGCAPDTGTSLWIDPGTVRFTPEHTRATIAIHNPGPLGRPIRDIRLSGPDWDALRIIEDELPRTLAGHDVAILTLEVSPAAFASGPDLQHREGHATLEFESERDHHEVAIEFSPHARARGSVIWTVLVAMLLSLAAGGLALVRTTPSTGPRSRAAMLGLGLGLGGLFAAAASLPLGPAWCSARLGDVVGAVELAQCRDGLGGRGLIGWVGDPSLAWLVVALSAATVGAVIHLPKQAVPIVARLLGFGLVIAALVASLGASEPSALVWAQQQPFELGGSNLPRLGVVIQPLAFLLALLMIADVGPASTIFARLDDLVWSALVVVLFLGAGSVPGLTDQTIPRLLHGSEIAVAMLAFTAKTALVVLVVRRLRVRPRSSPRMDYRTVTALALVNLLVTVSWSIGVRFFG